MQHRSTVINMVLLCDMMNFHKSIEFHDKARIIREKLCGKNHMDTASTYFNLANALCGAEDYKRAIDFYEKALEIQESILGMNHPDTVATRLNLSYARKQMGGPSM